MSEAEVIRRLTAQLDAGIDRINSMMADIDGMHMANEALWRERCDLQAEVELLRRENSALRAAYIIGGDS